MTKAPVGRIRRRATFRDLARPDGRGTSGPIRVSYTATHDGMPGPAVAYAIGRPVGSAVRRNRLRRRLRAGVAQLGPTLTEGSYLVRADAAASSLEFPTLVDRLGSAMKKAAGGAHAGTAR